METKKNYKNIILESSKDGAFQAVYVDAVSKYKMKNKYLFCEAIQKLVVKIGLVISRALVSPHSNESNCVGNLHYLCKRILNDYDLYNSFMNTDLNNKGNTIKHRLKMEAENVMIEKIAGLYNRMINLLCKRIKDQTLALYRLIPADTSNKSKKQKEVAKQKKVKKNTSNNESKKNKDTVSTLKVKEKKVNIKNTYENIYSKSSQNNRSVFCENEEIKINASLIKDHGIAYKTSLFKKKEIIMYGLNLNVRSNFKIKKIDTFLKTKEGYTKIKSSLGVNHYEVDSCKVSDNTITLKIIVEYLVKGRRSKVKEVVISKRYE